MTKTEKERTQREKFYLCMFLHTNLRQREKFLCTTTDLQQRAIRANTTKTPPTTDMSIPTKNTVLEPWQFSVCVLYVCNSSSSYRHHYYSIHHQHHHHYHHHQHHHRYQRMWRAIDYTVIHEWIIVCSFIFCFAKRGFTPLQFTQCRRVVRFGIFVSERPTACRQTEMADRNR